MHDLKHQFIRQEGRCIWRFLSSPGHGGLQTLVIFELCDLAVRGFRVVLHPQQLVSQKSLADRQSIEAAVAHQPSSTITNKAGLMGQGCILRSVDVDAVHLPEPFEPVGKDQITFGGGAFEGARQAPARPLIHPFRKG